MVAALFIHSLEPNAFTSRDVEVADRVGTQIAGPVGGSLLREREFELNVQRIALSEERVRRRSAELEAKALAEANEIKSNFVSAMSHELRTPLTSIIAFSDLLTREDSTNVTGRELQQMNVIKRNARHLESMINDLLDLTILDTGRMEIANHEFDFIQMARDTIESLKNDFEEKSQEVRFVPADDTQMINGDHDRLSQVLSNLLNNASKYSPEGTPIEVSVLRNGSSLTVTVSDRGPGFPAQERHKLFEMFYRPDIEITRRVSGTGIGLHISKQIIDAHGGSIDLALRPGGGTIASFRIPIIR